MDALVSGQSAVSSLDAGSTRGANITLDAGSTLGAGSTLDTGHASSGSSGILMMQSTTAEKQSNENIQLQPDISFDNLLGCKKCPQLSTALKNSKEWIKFFKKKLENTDKLLQVVNELEQEKKKYMELQLAYDSRSREWTYTSDQYAQLLLEVQPLKERLLKAEDECKKAIARAEATENKEESFKVSIDQYIAQIAEFRKQYNPNLISKLEKQVAKLRTEIKNLKDTINNQKKEIFELKEFQSNRRIYQERVNKKANWALTLALKYSNKLKELGHEEDGEISERLYKNQEEGIVLMKAQYDTWKSNKLRLYKGNLLKINLLPTYEEWIDDFDHEIVDEEDEEEEEDEEGNNKEGSEISILNDANKLESLLQQRNLKMKIKQEVVDPEVKTTKRSQKKIVKVKKEKQNDSNDAGTKKKKGRPSKKKGDLMSMEELNECIKKGKNNKNISNDVGIITDSDGDTDEEKGDFDIKAKLVRVKTSFKFNKFQSRDANCKPHEVKVNKEYNSYNAKNVKSKLNNSYTKLKDPSKNGAKACGKDKNKKKKETLFRDLPAKYKNNFVCGGILNLNELTNGTSDNTDTSVLQENVVGISKILPKAKEKKNNSALSNSINKSTQRDRIKNKLQKFSLSQNRDNVDDDNYEILPDPDLEDYISKVNLESIQENRNENSIGIVTNLDKFSEIKINTNDVNYKVVPGPNLVKSKERNREDSISEANLKAIIDEMNSWRCDKLDEFDESFSTDDLDSSLNGRDLVEVAMSPPSHGRDILEEDLQHSDSEDEFAKPNVLVPMLSTGFSPTLSDSDDNCEGNLELELGSSILVKG